MQGCSRVQPFSESFLISIRVKGTLEKACTQAAPLHPNYDCVCQRYLLTTIQQYRLRDVAMTRRTARDLDR